MITERVVTLRGEMESPVNPVNVKAMGTSSLSVQYISRTPCVHHDPPDSGICNSCRDHYGINVIKILFFPQPKSDLGITFVPGSLLHRGTGIGLSRCGAIPSEGRSVNDDVNLLLD
ncbi:hypothetical protein GW17_00058992 [Ensete ventricosum]|nr:hypothetical protein GW17_00058992 [Ensete ventricosum]